MSQPALHFLGAPRAEIDGQQIRAGRLLIYVSVAGQSHARDALTTLSLPEQDQGRARSIWSASNSVVSFFSRGHLEGDSAV